MKMDEPHWINRTLEQVSALLEQISAFSETYGDRIIVWMAVVMLLNLAIAAYLFW
jgi:hypothetical protein